MVRGPLGEICCGCSSLVKVIASALGSQERVTGVTEDSIDFLLLFTRNLYKPFQNRCTRYSEFYNTR